MAQETDRVLDRIRVREVAGVFRSRRQVEEAITALLHAGFDRADIDLMASAQAVREKLGGAYVAVEELADVSDVPRKSFVAREDVTTVVAGIAGILTPPRLGGPQVPDPAATILDRIAINDAHLAHAREFDDAAVLEV